MKKAIKLFARAGIALAIVVAMPATHAFADEATTTLETATTTPPDTATFAIRDGGILIGPFTITLPATSSPDVPLTATGDTAAHGVPARSALALLTTLDATTTSFDITNLQYFSSFNSFIINCILVPTASSSPDCYNWTYAVNGSFPSVGMDASTLQNNDAVYVIFGSQWQITTDKSSVTTSEPLVATAEEYDPSSGLYVPAKGEVVGAVQFDSNFVAKEFATSTTDASGKASLSIPTPGVYSVGIASTGYFPNTPITVSTPATTTATTTQHSGGSSGGISHHQLNIPSALAYLASQQHSDGSFDSPFLTDWAAIAFASADALPAKVSLRNYLLTATPTLLSVTGYERHAMALLALGVNPYDVVGVNYIQPIVDAFDGTQIGDASLDNDDIFALFALLHAGYDTSDTLIQKTVAFILSRQESNGAWDSSVDVTAAAIQALEEVNSLPNVPAAITKAKLYLHAQQGPDGGFGPPGQENSFSTSWVLQTIAALGEPAYSWAPHVLTPQDYLAGLQQSDGGIEPTSSSVQTRVWATEYAIPASLGETWDSLLQSFPKPVLTDTGNENSGTPEVLGAASSTPPVATSTPVATTSTPSPLSTAASTTIASTTLPRHTKQKILVPAKTAASSAYQVAAVASAPPTDFFKHLWNVILSFIMRWL